MADLRTLHAVALAASLQTAAEWTTAFRARQAGDDPSEGQATDFAKTRLGEGLAELADVLMTLGASLAAPESDNEAEVALRHFDRLLLTGRAARRLHETHQRLLSLYPAIPEALAEEARTLESEAARLTMLDPKTYAFDAAPFVARTLRFATEVGGTL